jgi:hypothetical protein
MTWTCIEITSGVLSQPARIYCGNTVGLDLSDIGKRLFFVEAVEADGGRIGLHDGASYVAALAAAKEVASEEGIPIHDETMGGTA